MNGGSMQAQLITYQLQDISQAEYLKKMVEHDAPVLAKVPGLISKVWLADEEKNAFGGFYLWENKTAMENFMHSDLVRAVVSRPFVKNVSSIDFEVNRDASLITRGLDRKSESAFAAELGLRRVSCRSGQGPSRHEPKTMRTEHMPAFSMRLVAIAALLSASSQSSAQSSRPSDGPSVDRPCSFVTAA